jgi:ribonuclease HI
MSKILTINTDGGARGNPGPAGIGVVIKSDGGEIIYQHGGFIGDATNNVAEYKALIKALTEAANLGATEVRINMDSELIVRQMTGVYKIKEQTLQGLAQEALLCLKKFERHSFAHVRRELNKEADALVNQAIDQALAHL